MAADKTWRIGEVAEMLNLKTHVLRFWETEFPQLEPTRTESGQRVYTEKHVAMARRIQTLLHDRGMTIDGARKLLDSAGASRLLDGSLENGLESLMEAGVDGASLNFLRTVEEELGAICQILKDVGKK